MRAPFLRFSLPLPFFLSFSLSVSAHLVQPRQRQVEEKVCLFLCGNSLALSSCFPLLPPFANAPFCREPTGAKSEEEEG